MFALSSFKKFIVNHYKSLTLFAIVGALIAVFYISFFTFLWKTAHLNYQLAISIAYIVAVILHFFANRYFTFKSNNPITQQIPRYFTILVINYFVTLFVMHIAVETFKLPPYVGILATIGVTFALNYFVSKLWIFKTASP
jgi:putative flippase GtrA